MARDPFISAFHGAINILDATEPVIRDMIESDLMDVAGINRAKVSDVITAGHALARRIAIVRERAIKEAFQLLKDVQ
jgi:hypothetical protein